MIHIRKPSVHSVMESPEDVPASQKCVVCNEFLLADEDVCVFHVWTIHVHNCKSLLEAGKDADRSMSGRCFRCRQVAYINKASATCKKCSDTKRLM